MPASTKKSKGKNVIHNNNDSNINNSLNHKGHAGKDKKQAENDEFEKVLADLSKATEAAGMQRAKMTERDEKRRKEREERHKNIAAKKTETEMEFDMMLRRKQQKQQFQDLLQQLLAAQRVLLDAPNTDFHGETVTENPHFDVAVGEMQGWRAHMEDEHLVDVAFPTDAPNSKEGLFCVFDGHSGRECAKRCRELIPKAARKYFTRAPEENASTTVDFEKVYLEVDSTLEKELTDGSGCTAVTVHVTPDAITCASVGDSRAVLCRNGAAFDLSNDHKPENALERARIEAAGGSVSENRVNGQLAMSRAMGDFTYKSQKNRDPMEQHVIAVPDVVSTPRQAGDAWVVLACDGIFDVLDNDELLECVLVKKHQGKSNVEICEEICRECLAPPVEGGGRSARAEGTDNMTIMIVDLK
ncbi:protein phosphatase 2C [Trypanosoma conorhini]|uniref:protein-serine/threonine phosphatase n=1 Tax=Trypanosoma conorhini TaxID=83891 RepID=A0A3R7KQB2_9TRYP|nr:protein phosphatase 2C [Trypanosoma conorhini]RNF13296.1 protein phosphatase 2C [Trypanosoma conorhini]